MKYKHTTRILHTGIAAFMLLQMLGEKLVGFPGPRQPWHTGDALFIGIHELMGAIALVLVCVYLIVVLDDAAGQERLLPWISAKGRNGLWLEIRHNVPGWLHGKLPPPEECHAIAGAVHGLGIFLALLLGLSGSMLFLGIGPRGDMTPDIKVVWEYHGIMATMMWVFVAGHAAMALAHELKGHGMLREMFSLKKDSG